MNKFKVGDDVEFLENYGTFTIGERAKVTYVDQSDNTVRLYSLNSKSKSGWVDTRRVKLVSKDPVLTPEEVLQYFKEKRQDELECIQPNGLVLKNMSEYTGVKYIFEYKWRVKPEPEVIEVNGKKYIEIME